MRLVASLLLLSSVVGGVLVLRHRSQETPGAGLERGATVAAALLAARDAATAFFTIDPAHVQEQIDAVLATSTGSFLHEYSARRNEVVSLVRDRDRTVSASVPKGGTAIADYTEDEAVVLVAVEQSAVEGRGKPVVDHLRTVLRMRRVGSVWKTAGLDQLAPSTTPGAYTVGRLPGGSSAVLAAAARSVEHLLASDYRDVDGDLGTTIGLLTLPFASDFNRTFSASVRPLTLREKSVTRAAVRAAGLVVRVGETATCLVYVDQVKTVKGTTTSTPVRLFVDLERVRGRWLVNGLGSP